MDNKKTIIASIIGVALLVVLVVGATFAYFTTVTSNDEGETLVTGKTDAIGSISLTNPTSKLHITLNALDMAQDNLNTYWATNDATLNYDTEEVQRDIAVATLTGGETTTHYECTTTINVSVSGTMVAGLQTGDAYIQFGGLLTNKVDLKNVSTTGYPVTFELNGTDKLSDKVSVSLAIENRNANQNSIAGKELTVTFSNADLDCKVVEGEIEEIIPEGAEAFAIYSETDKSLRFYNNLDFDDVNVGDTYRNLVVTAKYTGIEYSDSSHQWTVFGEAIDFAEAVDKIIIEEKISPISTKWWFANFASATLFDLTNLDVSNVTNMSSMFGSSIGYSASISFVGLERWDTSNVTDMSNMFSMVTNIPDISGWDVSNVTDMSNMFYQAFWGDKIPDISDWDTSNVTNMSNMFFCVSGIPDISGWDVSNVTDMSNMFESASNIPDISGWDTSNVTNMSEMFLFATTGYTAENPLDLSGWDVSKVTHLTNFALISPTGSIIEPNFK